MKKILITLCTLLAVGSGEYAQAFEGEISERSTTKVEPGRSGTTGKAETGPSTGAKSEASSAAEKQTMTFTNGKPTPDKFDVASSFNLKISDGDQLSDPIPGRRGSGETDHTLTRKDGSLYTIKINKDGKVLSKQFRKNGTDNVGVDYHPAMRDSNGNPLTKQEAFQARRTQAKQATPEAKAAARTQVETQVSEVKAENPEATKAARTQVEAAIADPNQENVQAAVEQFAPEGTTSEQISQYVQQMVEFIKSMPEKGANAVKAVVQALSDLFSTGQIVNRSAAAPVEQPAAPTASAYEDYGDGSYGYAKSVDRSASPTGVDDLFKNEKSTTNPDAEGAPKSLFSPDSTIAISQLVRAAE